MPSKNNANSDFGANKVNDSKGVNAGFNNLSKEVSRRTPRQSGTAGSIQTHNGVIHAPRRVFKSSATHPWKVTSNGDDTVSIGEGVLMKYSNPFAAAETTPDYFHFKGGYDYAGGAATVTGTGIIYGKIAYTESSNYQSEISASQTIYSTRLEFTGTLTVDYASSMPTTTGFYFFEIARLSLTDDVAIVDKQILTYNPPIHQYYVFVAS